MSIIPVSLPYRAEYAKTGRAACKGCKGLIAQNELKLAVMIQSPFHDGKDPWFHHVPCFFQKHRPKTVGDISHFEQLRYEDQQMIRKKIDAVASVPVIASKKEVNKDYKVEYAQSGRSKCAACEDHIPNKDIRISKKDYTSETAMRFGGSSGVDRWYHVECFVKVRAELGFFQNAKSIPGYKDLDKKDQTTLDKQLPAMKPPVVKKAETSAAASSSNATGKRRGEGNGNGSSSSKRVKVETETTESLLRKQSDELFRNRDAVERAGFKKAQLFQILTTNNHEIPFGTSNILDWIADIMTFGALQKCSKCKNGQIVFRSGVGYQCLGDLNEFTKCMNIMDVPPRVPFKVPNDLREEEPFASFKFKAQDRIIQKVAPSAAVASTSADEPKPKIVRQPLRKFNFVLCTSDKEKMDKWTSKITQFGGKILKKLSSKTVALITTQDEIDNEPPSATIQTAEKKGIPLVKSDFVDSLTDVNYNLSEQMRNNLLCNWVPDVGKWLHSKNGDYEERKGAEPGRGDKYEKHLSSIKLKMKGGAVVDPDTDLDDIGHVLKYGEKGFYTCVLNRTSIEEDRNSFYKQQIIESDIGHQYWVFQAWGRIGTTIGGQKLHENLMKDEAIEIFCNKFHDLTGNIWGYPFEKRAGLYTMLDVDFGGEKQEEISKLMPSEKDSTLPMPVQELVCLIFDVNRMKMAMVEFELNLDEMPLGKISRKQVLDAYRALSDASNALEKAKSGEITASITSDVIRDVTNRFYTLIPHNFGARKPPLLDSDSLVKTKLEMLESLLEIELAYELLLEGKNSIDSHYKTLNAAIEPVESGSEEFSMLKNYMTNTHGATHTNYKLRVQHMFKVNRKGEETRYDAFKSLHNRKLLWHGSRTTNFAGILSQGLRIAPPEAPATGYMFGKGIYFADMVSKSANYCYPDPDHNNTGLLLVCEVALGDMCEMKKAKETLAEAPRGYHSVKGLGQNVPNPVETITLPDGVEVPLGKPVKSGVNSCSLQYNEYIVYNVAQVNVRYLMKVSFDFETRRR